jgi:hypothetical protein
VQQLGLGAMVQAAGQDAGHSEARRAHVEPAPERAPWRLGLTDFDLEYIV